MYIREWFRSEIFLVCVQEIGWSDEGVMEMGSGDDVPGVTGLGACEEAACIIDKVGNDHFDDLLGESRGRGRACHRGFWRNTLRTQSPDSS